MRLRYLLLFLLGLGIMAVPDAYEGPLLLRVSEDHAVKLVDAIGLVLVVLATLLFLRAVNGYVAGKG